MTNEEMTMLHQKFHDGVRMMIEKLGEVAENKKSWNWDEMSKAADIMKDLAETHKNIAKAHCLYTEHSEERF